MGLGDKIKALKHDANLVRLRKGVVMGVKGVRAGTGQYLTNKIPILQWIPAYSPKWLLGDFTAGQSVGLLLIPQAVSYSVLAAVPFQQALLASLLPGVIYAVMGTSRDISVGPTSTTAVLTGSVVAGLSASKVPAPLAAAAVSFCVGLWSLIIGVFNLAFVFDFVSVPMAYGVTIGLGIIAITLQLPIILGLVGIPPIFAATMPAVIKSITKTNPITLAIGLSSIVILGGLQFVEQKFGRIAAVKILCINRHILVIIIFTAVSFFINKGRPFPLFSVLGDLSTPAPTAAVPLISLTKSLFLPSSLLFLSTALEHITVARTFAHKGGYSFNQNQEMVALGVTNIINSLFGGLLVGGGDISRSAVNAASGVSSPLSGAFTSLTVAAGIYAMKDVLTFLPLATVSAIIIVAVADKMPEQKMIGLMWKQGFVDFIGFQLAFNVTIIAGTTGGLALGVGFMVGYTLLRLMFSRPSPVTAGDLEYHHSRITAPSWTIGESVPSGTQVIKFETDIIFVNAERVKRHVIDTVYTYTQGNTLSATEMLMRPWNMRRDKHISTLRRAAGISEADQFIPHLKVVVLDLTSTSFIDAAAIRAFMDIKETLRRYGGEGMEFRFSGMNTDVTTRYRRAGWDIRSPYDEDAGEVEAEGAALVDGAVVRDYKFEYVEHAIQYQGQLPDTIGRAITIGGNDMQGKYDEDDDKNPGMVYMREL